MASPAQKNWGGKNKFSWSRPSDSWKLITLVFFIHFEILDKQLFSQHFSYRWLFSSAKIEIDLVSPSISTDFKSISTDFKKLENRHVHLSPSRGDTTGLTSRDYVITASITFVYILQSLTSNPVNYSLISRVVVFISFTQK